MPYQTRYSVESLQPDSLFTSSVHKLQEPLEVLDGGLLTVRIVLYQLGNQFTDLRLHRATPKVEQFIEHLEAPNLKEIFSTVYGSNIFSDIFNGRLKSAASLFGWGLSSSGLLFVIQCVLYHFQVFLHLLYRRNRHA